MTVKVVIALACLMMVVTCGVQGRSWRAVRQVQAQPEIPVTEQVFTESVVDGAGALRNCPCPAPPQFNPVCGTDRVTYGNQQKLECAKFCGRSVELAFVGVCG